MRNQGLARQGTFIFMPFFAMNRSEENWEDPDSFQPERFLQEDADVARSGQFSLTAEEQCVPAPTLPPPFWAPLILRNLDFATTSEEIG